MLRIINNFTEFPRNLIKAEVNALPIGTTFLGKIGAESCRTLGIRVYLGIVDLGNPQKTWTAPDGNFPAITDFQEVDVEAIVKEIR